MKKITKIALIILGFGVYATAFFLVRNDLIPHELVRKVFIWYGLSLLIAFFVGNFLLLFKDVQFIHKCVDWLVGFFWIGPLVLILLLPFFIVSQR